MTGAVLGDVVVNCEFVFCTAVAGAKVLAGAIFKRGGRGGVGVVGGVSGVIGVRWVVPGTMLICEASVGDSGVVFVGMGRDVCCIGVCFILRLRGRISKYNTNSAINVAAMNEK